MLIEIGIAGFIYNTVGVHPCSCNQFAEYEGGAEKMLEELKALAVEAKEGGWCIAFGEFGLDYDRLGEFLNIFLLFVLFLSKCSYDDVHPTSPSW